MPNWTENIINIKKKDWAKFKEVAINQEGDVDFDILLPRPLAVRIDTFYNHIFTNWNKTETEQNEQKKFQKYYKQISEGKLNQESAKWFENNKGEEIRLREVITEAGGDTRGWYDWQCEEWGTKWNASDTCIDNDDELDDMDDEDEVVVRFNTAWSDPEPWYFKLATVVPFENECIEEGGFFHFTGISDGEGSYSISDDTEEYFKQQEELDED